MILSIHSLSSKSVNLRKKALVSKVINFILFFSLLLIVSPPSPYLYDIMYFKIKSLMDHDIKIRPSLELGEKIFDFL